MEPCYRYRARLERVVDGDTIDVLIELGFYVTLRERVRLEGIDTPEIYRVPKDSEEYKKGDGGNGIRGAEIKRERKRDDYRNREAR